MGRAILLLLAVLLAGCSSDPYPMPIGPPHTSQSNPSAVGSPIPAVVLYLQVRPGDRIELLSAEPVGSGNRATVRFFLSRPVIMADGSRLIGKALEDLSGAEVAVSASPSAGPDNTVGIVAELTVLEPGRYQMTAIRLRYRLNGGGERVGEGIDTVFTVCAADPAPTSCEEEEDRS